MKTICERKCAVRKGDRIRYTSGPLGTTSHWESTKFNGTVQCGDFGVFIKKHPNPTLAREGWFLTETIAKEPQYVVVHESMFEAAAGEILP